MTLSVALAAARASNGTMSYSQVLLYRRVGSPLEPRALAPPIRLALTRRAPRVRGHPRQPPPYSVHTFNARDDPSAAPRRAARRRPRRARAGLDT